MAQPKSLRKQLETESKKYAKKVAASDKKVAEAMIYGAEWWNLHALASVDQYEKDLTDAYVAKYGSHDPGIRLQIKKTARLWQMRDRLAAELDMENSFMRMAQGSMKQMKFEIDQRLLLLEKFDRTLTADLTAIGLNFNAQSAQPKDDTKNQPSDEDALISFLKAAQKDMNDIPDIK